MKEAELKIRKLPDPVLRRKAAKVVKVDDSDRDALFLMAKAMYLNQGVGLAALQVGIDRQLAVIDVGDGLIKLINPVITRREGSETQEEGCLSVPGEYVRVKRSKKVTVNFLKEGGEAVQLKADGLLARAIQHEIDHLSGCLIVEYLNPVKKMLVKRRFKKQA